MIDQITVWKNEIADLERIIKADEALLEHDAKKPARRHQLLKEIANAEDKIERLKAWIEGDGS